MSSDDENLSEPVKLLKVLYPTATTADPSVQKIVDELFEEGWDDEATELERYELWCYAEIYSSLCAENIGGEWDYNWSNEEIAPYSLCPGAWVVEKINT